MKANELRIGNYILINDKVICMDTKMFHAVIHGFNGYEPESIPLTEEWLVKLGFEAYYWPDKSISGWHKNGVKYLFKGLRLVWFDVHIIHVHQLQNLYFSLTGEELTP